MPCKGKRDLPSLPPSAAPDSVTFRSLFASEGGFLPGLLLGGSPFDGPPPPHHVLRVLGRAMSDLLVPEVAMGGLSAARKRPVLALLGPWVGAVLLTLWLWIGHCHVRQLHVVGGGGVPGTGGLGLRVVANVVHHHGAGIPDRDAVAAAEDFGGDGDGVEIIPFVGNEVWVSNVQVGLVRSIAGRDVVGFRWSIVDDFVDVSLELLGVCVVVEGKALKHAVERDV